MLETEIYSDFIVIDGKEGGTRTKLGAAGEIVSAFDIARVMAVERYPGVLPVDFGPGVFYGTADIEHS
jgi:hypothetical protein